MRGRTARRKTAERWVRRNRPAIDVKLPAQVERYVFRQMEIRSGDYDMTRCPYYQGVGTCAGGCWTEPACKTDEPLNGWPRERMSRGWTS